MTSSISLSDTLGTIQELARGIVDTCSEYKDDESLACMKSANEIFELAESVRPLKETEAPYGLRMDRREADGDGVSGSRKISGTVRHLSDPEHQARGERCKQQLAAAGKARARTHAAKRKTTRRRR